MKTPERSVEEEAYKKGFIDGGIESLKDTNSLDSIFSKEEANYFAEKSVEEIVDRFSYVMENTKGTISNVKYYTRQTVIKMLTQTLQTERQKREEMVGVQLNQIGNEWKQWKEGKDAGYIYDEGYTFFENLSRGGICSLLDEIEALTQPNNPK